MSTPNPLHAPADVVLLQADIVELVAGRIKAAIVRVADRPEALDAQIDDRTFEPRAFFAAGPLTIRFTDPATARLWASAFEVVAAQLEIAAEQAAGLRHTEMETS
ncbi:hypothetical protein [Actinomadura miaoliensis]|uniref:Uncharacterized protein n=1 Tax=Actinomadura miaoliensis TaxID=430685 RepID=A0ABP7V4T4_9ACTN